MAKQTFSPYVYIDNAKSKRRIILGTGRFSWPSDSWHHFSCFNKEPLRRSHLLETNRGTGALSLSTFSPTSYLVFPLAIMLHMQIQGNSVTSKAHRLFMSAYIIAIGIFVFFTFVWEQPFMKDKVLNWATLRRKEFSQ